MTPIDSSHPADHGRSTPHRSAVCAPTRRLAATLALGVVVLAAAAGCSSGGDGDAGPDATTDPADRQAAVTQVVNDVLGPNLRSAEGSATAAVDAVTTYCATPTPESQKAALDAVGAGIDAYERLDPVDMGPITMYRTDGHVVYPVDADRIEELIVSGPPTDVVTVNERTASSTRGLSTAEFLLQRDPPPASDPELCGYLVAITTNAAQEISDVVLDSFEGTNGSSAYFLRLTGDAADAESAQDVLNILVNMQMTVLDSDAALLADPGEVPEAVVRRATASHLATIAELWGTGTTGLSTLVDDELAHACRRRARRRAPGGARPDGAGGRAPAARRGGSGHHRHRGGVGPRHRGRVQ